MSWWQYVLLGTAFLVHQGVELWFEERARVNRLYRDEW